jgi:hypothetical protein
MNNVGNIGYGQTLPNLGDEPAARDFFSRGIKQSFTSIISNFIASESPPSVSSRTLDIL